jgi:hypothetical protein
LTQALLLHKGVTLFGESGGHDPAMSLPFSTFCCQNALAKYVDNSIDFDRLLEVVSACRDLHDGFGVAAVHIHLSGAGDNEDFSEAVSQFLSV